VKDEYCKVVGSEDCKVGEKRVGMLVLMRFGLLL
jgi:hypothetical protein